MWGQKYQVRQPEMMKLRNKSVKNLDFLVFILFTCAGLTEKWAGMELDELDRETLLISCSFPAPPLPSSFPGGVLAE